MVASKSLLGLGVVLASISMVKAGDAGRRIARCFLRTFELRNPACEGQDGLLYDTAKTTAVQYCPDIVHGGRDAHEQYLVMDLKNTPISMVAVIERFTTNMQDAGCWDGSSQPECLMDDVVAKLDCSDV